MIKKISSEIKIVSIMLAIFLAVVITGILGYKGLQTIVAEVSHSSEPELKLTLVKEIVSDISEAENNIKSYNLTRNVKYLSPFYNSILIADKNFTELKELTKINTAQLTAVEQMEALVDEKYSVLNEMLTLYPDENIKNELAKISNKIAKQTEQLKAEQQETEIVASETTPTQPKKKTFFQRLFGKEEAPEGMDSAVAETRQRADLQSHRQLQRSISKEIEQVNKQHVEQRNILKQKELALIERSGILMSGIGELFTKIENIEKGLIIKKIELATERAQQTNRLIALFCVLAGLSLIIVCFVSINFVHKKRKYEEYLEQEKNHAELLAHSKEIFLANMSHEIRTPMNAISGFTNQILKTDLDAEQREQLKIVQKSNEHLIRIVNDILDYSKMEAGKFNFEHASFNPDKVLKEVIELSKPLIKNDKVKINYIVNGSMPEFVIGDAVRLKQIVLNLLSNSIKFTEQGEVNITAGFKSTDGNLLLDLKVSDTGIGIAKDKIKEIFGEFQQADATIYYKYGGTGLGLPITKKLVELQNGNINIESIEGKGTTTSILIPYTESKAGTMFFKESGKPVTVDERFLKTLKVLIADDDEYNRKLLNVILRKWNADVKEAKNGKEVLEELMKDRYDILLLDIRMPEMNGIEAAQRIRNLKDLIKAETPIIALTAVTTEEKKKRCREAGINDFLSKPFKEEELFKKIVSLTDLENSGYIHKDTNQPNSRVQMKNESNNLFSLDELRQLSNGDEKFVEEMMNIFIKTTTEGMNAIEKALSEKDYSTIAEYTHKLSPPCRHMGADELYTRFKTMEDEVRKHENPSGLDEMVAKAREQTDKVIAGLKKELKDKQIS